MVICVGRFVGDWCFRNGGSYGSKVVGHGVVAFGPDIWLSLALRNLFSCIVYVLCVLSFFAAFLDVPSKRAQWRYG